MIPPRKTLQTITQPETFGGLVELITAATKLGDRAAEKLADSLLYRLGLYGPTPERQHDWCTAMYFKAYIDDRGWVQCGKKPGHVRRGDPLHQAWRGHECWSDDHRRAVPAAGEND